MGITAEEYGKLCQAESALEDRNGVASRIATLTALPFVLT